MLLNPNEASQMYSLTAMQYSLDNIYNLCCILRDTYTTALKKHPKWSFEIFEFSFF